jgi:tetratricopeptide (TPR) repeat protein
MPEPKKTFFKDLSELLKRHENTWNILKNIFAMLFGLGSGLVAFYPLMMTYVDQSVERRMISYERLLGGLSLNQSGDFNEAVESFRATLEAKDGIPLTGHASDLLFDGFLYALVNCDNPDQYSVEYSRLQANIGTSVPESAWRAHHVAWYFLRTGKAQDAVPYLARAIQLYDAREERKLAADSVRGQLFASLARYDLPTAIECINETCQRNPADYTIEDWVRQAATWPQERWFQQMQRLYGDSFQKAVTELKSQLEAMKAKTKDVDA